MKCVNCKRQVFHYITAINVKKQQCNSCIAASAMYAAMNPPPKKK